MSRPLPPLNALRAFEAAGRHQNFSRAAEELSVGHSAISRHVRGLEHRLGVQLFRDLARGVQLTADGRAYLDQITPALDMISEATEDVGGVPEGRITLSSEPLFAQKVIMPRLPRFLNAFPDIEVRIEATTQLADVVRYEADLAIRFAHRGTLDMPSDLISDTPLYPFATPDLRPEGWHTPRDLLSYRLYVDRYGEAWSRWAAMVGIREGFGNRDRGRLDTRLSVEAALHGAGVYLGSEDCVWEDVRAGRLIRCFDTGLQDGAYRLICRERGLRRRAVRQFRHWILDETARFRASQT